MVCSLDPLWRSFLLGLIGVAPETITLELSYRNRASELHLAPKEAINVLVHCTRHSR
jgi:hypothetical protein